MTNETDMVADIVREMRGDPSRQLSSWEDTINTRRIVRQFLCNYAARIEAAHQREITQFTSYIEKMSCDFAAVYDRNERLREVLKTITAEMCEQCRLAHPGDTCVEGCEYLKMSKEVCHD